MDKDKSKDKSKEKPKIVAEEVGSFPTNARIFINHSTNPPEIKFEYPDDKINQVRNSSSTYIIAAAISVIILLILVNVWYFYLDHYAYPNSNKAHIDNATIHTYTSLGNYTNIGVDYTWMDKKYTTSIMFEKQGQFWYYPGLVDVDVVNGNKALLFVLIPIAIIYVSFMILFFIMVRLVALLFYKTNWGHKAFPELNKRLHDEKYSAEFFKDDVTPQVKYTDATNTLSVKKWTVELPMFKNMYMDYEASGEFSKYLTKVSIIEHPFSRYVKKKGKEMKKSRSQLRREERWARRHGKDFAPSKYDPFYDKKANIYLWKTIFEFKQRPEDGSLKIWFT